MTFDFLFPGASPNLGSAVTSSMNLTNCDNEHNNNSLINSGSAGHIKMDSDSAFYQVRAKFLSRLKVLLLLGLLVP